jgi:hypothetical protein
MAENYEEFCECCGQPITNYKVTITRRNLIWLFVLGKIGKTKYSEDDYWVNYKEVHEVVARSFGKTVNGKWKPMVLSGYSKMGKDPWNLIEKHHDSGVQKFKRNGDWRLTSRGIAWLNNKITIPEIAWFNKGGCYKHSHPIYAKDVKDVNFTELIDTFNSF